MQKLKKGLYAFDSTLFKIVRIIIFVAVSVLILSVALQVFARYVFSRLPNLTAPRWTTELCCFMLVYTVFLGAALALRDGLHVQLEISRLHIPAKVQFVLNIISAIAIYVFIGAVFYFGLKITITNKASLSEAMKIPYAWMYGVLPVSSVLIFIGYSCRLLHKTDKPAGAPGAPDNGVIIAGELDEGGEPA